MTFKSVALNSFTPVSTPTIVDNVEIDGYVDGKPVILRRMRDGMLMPAIGTVLPLSMGTGIVSGYSNDMLVVDVVEPNEDFEFETKDSENPDILDVHEYNKKHSKMEVRSMRKLRKFEHHVCKTISLARAPYIRLKRQRRFNVQPPYFRKRAKKLEPSMNVATNHANGDTRNRLRDWSRYLQNR